MEVFKSKYTANDLENALKHGGAPSRTAWYRPPDWPDITSLPLRTDRFEAYLTLDKGIYGAKDTITVRTFGYNSSGDNEEGYVAIGTVEDEMFIPAVEYANPGTYINDFLINLNAVDTRFPVIHLKISSSLDGRWDNDVRNFFEVDIPAVEVYSNMYSSSLISNECPSVEVMTQGIENAKYSQSGLQNRGIPYNCKVIDWSKNTVFTVISRALTSIFSNYRNLRLVKFPTVAKNSIKLDVATQSDTPTSAFAYCYNLIELDLSIFDTSEVTSLNGTFMHCYRLKTLNVSGWDLSACTNMTNCFNRCDDLVDLITDGCTMPSVSFSLSGSTLLSVDSLLGVIAALPVLDSGKTATLTLGATNTAKLTAGQIAVATEKGWTVA